MVRFVCREIERSKITPMSDKPYVNNEHDTYLTLELLAAILEALSRSGKNIHLRPYSR